MGDEAKIVRPFGLMGGRYKVGGKTLRKYRLSWIVGGVCLAIFVIGDEVGLPTPVRYGIILLGLIATGGLSFMVTREGRRL